MGTITVGGVVVPEMLMSQFCVPAAHVLYQAYVSCKRY
jgi:hypothetical protein